MTGAAPLDPAPLDPAALADALRPFGESRMLPASAYTDPAVLAWERRHLFAGAWTCAGRVDGLFGGEVTQRALTVGDVAVLLTRAPGETLRGFANVCRHRGHELLPDGGTAGRPSVVCPYHGWAYRLDGSLATAPGMGAAARTPFDPGRYGLVDLPVEVWHGWVFVNALGTAPPFPSYLGELAGLIAPYRPEDLVRGTGHVYQVAANWKVIVENYQECYHCPLIHPELCRVSPPASGQNWALPGAWVGGAMDLRDGAETMSLDGRSAGEYIDGAPRGTVRYIAVFPNLLISAHPDYVMTHRLEPLSPDLTRVECAWYFPLRPVRCGASDAAQRPGPVVRPDRCGASDAAQRPGPVAGIDPGYAADFWDITNREDWAACESVQRGLASPHFRPGPLAAGEDAVYQWVSLLARCYLDPIGALGAACVDTGRVNRGQ